MNQKFKELDLLSKTIKIKKAVKKKILEKDSNNSKAFSWVSYFAGVGEEYREELTKNGEILENNIIDFSQDENKKKESVENKIEEIIKKSSTNKQLIEQGNHPIIWFKNIEKIKSGSALESSLLPVFDPEQNTKLFSQNLDLSKYILIATSSTRDMGRLPPPLTSRLDCVNVGTAEPKQFFLDKYFNWILFSSLVLIFVLGKIAFPFPPKTKKILRKCYFVFKNFFTLRRIQQAKNPKIILKEFNRNITKQ